jgi:predicted metal-dependent hydrolase
MDRTGQVELSDGRRIEFPIRAVRSRSIRMKLSPREGLVVTAPKRVSVAAIVAFVVSKSRWLEERLPRLEEARARLAAEASVRPELIELPALAERWSVEYVESAARSVTVRAHGPERLVVSGAVGNAALCQAALRRWLMRRAREELPPWVALVSEETGLGYASLAVRSQRSRWGSCSTRGELSLNCKLLFLPEDLARFVLIHELCHTLEHNHSVRFWDLVRGFEPRTDEFRKKMRDLWDAIPGWAQRP